MFYFYEERKRNANSINIITSSHRAAWGAASSPATAAAPSTHIFSQFHFVCSVWEVLLRLVCRCVCVCVFAACCLFPPSASAAAAATQHKRFCFCCFWIQIDFFHSFRPVVVLRPLRMHLTYYHWTREHIWIACDKAIIHIFFVYINRLFKQISTARKFCEIYAPRSLCCCTVNAWERRMLYSKWSC